MGTPSVCLLHHNPAGILLPIKATILSLPGNLGTEVLLLLTIQVHPFERLYVEVSTAKLIIRWLKRRGKGDMSRYIRNGTMLTTSDVGRLLNVHINTVRRWTNKGILKVYRIGPRGDRRFRQEDITTFLVEQSENARRA
jgi:excisionase family DNA binding protein